MRRWIGLIAAILAVLVLVLAVYGIGRGALSLLNGMDSGAGEPDPMFNQFPSELSRETRPPELTGEEGEAPSVAEDRSEDWVYPELSPVDRTAEELAREQD